MPGERGRDGGEHAAPAKRCGAQSRARTWEIDEIDIAMQSRREVLRYIEYDHGIQRALREKREIDVAVWARAAFRLRAKQVHGQQAPARSEPHLEPADDLVLLHGGSV